MRASAILSALVALGLTAELGAAGERLGDPNCCARCGRHTDCAPKVCQVVREVKKEVKTYWEVQCEEFCPLLPGKGCGHGAGTCDCQCGPRTGHPKTVKRLVRKEYVVEVPVYKGVVKYLCCQCAGPETPAVAPSHPPIPAPPPMPPLPPQPTFAPKAK